MLFNEVELLSRGNIDVDIAITDSVYVSHHRSYK